jgi:hypothetical protein
MNTGPRMQRTPPGYLFPAHGSRSVLRRGGGFTISRKQKQMGARPRPCLPGAMPARAASGGADLVSWLRLALRPVSRLRLVRPVSRLRLAPPC